MIINIRDKPKVTRVTRTDSIPASGASFDEQGFFHDTPVVTSTGIFEYVKNGRIRRELRLPEHVFDPESLASYEGKPVIITHRAGRINKDNVMDEIVGTICGPGFRDGDNVRCKVVIHDIDKVKAMPYRELSLGYDLDLVEESGEWDGQHYDAVQTNIRVNHLAIVATARAGDQAHLNLDGEDPDGMDDIKNLTGGKKTLGNKLNLDGVSLTPEELVEAINNYKAANPSGGAPTNQAPEPAPVKGPAKATDGTAPKMEPQAPAPAAEPAAEPVAQAEPAAEPAPEPEPEPEKKDGGDAVSNLIAALKGLLAELEGNAGNPTEPEPVGEPESDPEPDPVKEPEKPKTDSGDEEPSVKQENQDGKGCNADCGKGGSAFKADSADDFAEKLRVCRVGDRLHMDGLEDMTVTEAKKAVILKVYPEMRLDGMDDARISGAFEVASQSASARKGASDNFKKIMGGKAEGIHTDSKDEVGADEARTAMIKRMLNANEGGNE